MTTVDQTVTAAGLRGFMRSWATGVAVVTCAVGGRPTGCTVNTFTSVSLDPPLVLVSLSGSSRTLAAITTRQVYGVNVLSAGQRSLAARFATGTSSADRFAGLAHRMESGVPVLTAALAAAVCVVAQATVLADHVLLFGRPIWLSATGRADPAIFFGGGYRSLSG
jgi:flavin reductase (DIM6/NTAB) family NADH-FMN oxidoreductase RutF